MINKSNPELSWISVILRLAVAVMFGMGAYGKFSGGFENYVGIMSGMFKDTVLPGFLLTPYIYILPFAEVVIFVWLLIGIKLREAWIFTALVLLTLGFGMMVARQAAIASANYIYMMMACLGIYLSKYDSCTILGCKCKK